MTTLTDILNELRAIRIGNQLLLKKFFGVEFDLMRISQDGDLHYNILGTIEGKRKREPKDAKSILHRDDQRSAAKEALLIGGDDTNSIIAFIGEQYGVEAALNVREFYESEIIGKGREM